MRKPVLLMIVAAAVAAYLPALASASVDGEASGPVAVVDANERALYGFSTAPDAVQRAVVDGNTEWGTPLTDDEARQLRARSDLVGRLASSLGEAAMDRRWFAGGFLRHEGDGTVVVYATNVDEAQAWVDSTLDATTRKAVEVLPADVSWGEMEGALRASVGSVVDTSIGRLTIHSGEIDGATNSVRLYAEGSFPEQQTKRDNVVVRIAAAEAPQDDACTSRSSGCSPRRGGIHIRRGSSTGNLCTYGFTVLKTGTADREFWTAGHCGYTGSNVWYHGTASLGSETFISDYTNGSRDYMRVEVTDTTTLGLIYGRSETVASWEWPVQGGPVCASLGNSNTYDCGTILASSYSWTSSTNGRKMYGARHQSISTMGGDSGSPIFRDAGSTFVANGLHITSSGGFTRVWDLIDGTWFPS